jgi:hypothetical protein
MTSRDRPSRVARVALARLSLMAGLLGGTMIGCGSGDDTMVAVPLSADGAARADGTTVRLVDGAGANDGGTPDATAQAEELDGGEAGAPVAALSTTSIDFGLVNCSSSSPQMLRLRNVGTTVLAVSAATTGSAFSVSPTTLSIEPGQGNAGLTVTADVPSSAMAGVPLTGSLNLFTSDPKQTSITVPLSVTPAGATVVFAFAPASPTSATFAPTAVGSTSQIDHPLSFKNVGNGPATVTFGPPADSQFTLSAAGDGGTGTTLAAGATLSNVTASFTPALTTSPRSTTSTVTIDGVTCGTSVNLIAYQVGQASADAGTSADAGGADGEALEAGRSDGGASDGASGLDGSTESGAPTSRIDGWPATIDFGPSPCDGSAPADKFFVLTNSGGVNAAITSTTITGAADFSVTDRGGVIPAASSGGPGELKVTVHAPPVPARSPTTPITATLTVQTDAESTAHTIALTEEPFGGVLAFDTSETPNFGSFVHGPESQNFSVTNTGTAPVDITLTMTSDSSADTAAFTLSTTSFSIAPNGTQADSVFFSPSGPSNTGSIRMTVFGPICQPLPPALRLTGRESDGGNP